MKQSNVSINGKDAITVNPGEYKKMDESLKSGEHTMKLADGSEIKFTTEDMNVMLNPTGATYVKIKQEYGFGVESGDNYVTVEIDGKKYNGPFQVLTDPAIVLSGINYGVDEPFPDEVTIPQGHSQAVKTKLFRKDDFIQFYKKEY